MLFVVFFFYSLLLNRLTVVPSKRSLSCLDQVLSFRCNWSPFFRLFYFVPQDFTCFSIIQFSVAFLYSVFCCFPICYSFFAISWLYICRLFVDSLLRPFCFHVVPDILLFSASPPLPSLRSSFSCGFTSSSSQFSCGFTSSSFQFFLLLHLLFVSVYLAPSPPLRSGFSYGFTSSFSRLLKLWPFLLSALHWLGKKITCIQFQLRLDQVWSSWCNWLPFYRPFSFASQPFDCFAYLVVFVSRRSLSTALPVQLFCFAPQPFDRFAYFVVSFCFCVLVLLCFFSGGPKEPSPWTSSVSVFWVKK